MGWGGLRGAVGIALALSLNSEVNHYTSSEEVDDYTRQQYRDFTAKLFGMVGGIAFLTLGEFIWPQHYRKEIILTMRSTQLSMERLVGQSYESLD